MDYLIIGAGQFGCSLAQDLTDYGHSVLLIDKNEAKVTPYADSVSKVLVGDCCDMDTILELGVDDFDACFVCISNDFQSSLEITSNLKDAQAQKIVAKSERLKQAQLLEKIGADEVIFPERDMAKRVAMHYAKQGIFSNYEILDNMSLAEIELPDSWAHKSLSELKVRQNYNVTVIGFTEDSKFIEMIDPNIPLDPNKRILVLGANEDILALPS